MPVLQKKALFSAFIICQVLRIIQNYMEVSPAKSLILSATIHGGSYFFIQPEFVTRICDHRKFLNDFLKEWVVRMDELNPMRLPKMNILNGKSPSHRPVTDARNMNPRKNGAL